MDRAPLLEDDHQVPDAARVDTEMSTPSRVVAALRAESRSSRRGSAQHTVPPATGNPFADDDAGSYVPPSPHVDPATIVAAESEAALVEAHDGREHFGSSSFAAASGTAYGRIPREPDSEEKQHSPVGSHSDDGDARRLSGEDGGRRVSFSASHFLPRVSVSGSPLRRPSGAAAAAIEDDAGLVDAEAEASATDLERQALTSGDSEDTHDGPMPLLLEYHKANSSIRRDWTTVDWWFSRSSMHRVRRLLRSANKGEGWRGDLKNYALAAQGWIILCLVGICTALTAAVIHSVSAWLSDLKSGYCSGHNVFSTRRVCCMDEQQPNVVCTAWSSWNDGVASPDTAGAFVWNGVIYITLAGLFAGAGSWVCVIFARQAAGSGIAELKIVLGGFIIKKLLGIRTLFFKTIGLTLAVASGMSLGKEGPMVHIACAWGHILSRPFLKYGTNEVKKREILSASVAAGVTAAFGAPLGGVLFSLEVVSSYYPPKTMWRAFWCAICTALVLETIDPFQTGKLVQFAVSISQWHWFELFPIGLLGALGGILGAAFIGLNVRFTAYRKNSRWLRARPTIEVVILAVVTGVLSFPNLFMRGNSGTILAQLFSSCSDVSVAAEDDRNAGETDSVIHALCDHDDNPWSNMSWLLVAALLKFFLTTVTYGSAIPSGVFMPSLCIGALMGRVLGWLMREWHENIGDTFIFTTCAGKTNCINPALYALVGAAGVLGGITRMTVSLAVIMMEVSGGVSVIVPIMVAVVTAKWFGDAFGKASLYGQLIELNGLPHVDPHEELDLVNPAAECMTADPVCLTTYGQTIEGITELLANEIFHGFPIVDNTHDQIVTGFIARSDLEYELEKLEKQGDSLLPHSTTRVHFSREPPPFSVGHFVDFSHSVDKYPIQVRPSMPVDRIMTLFQALGLRYVLCCSPRGRILGILKKKQLLLYLVRHNVHHR